MHRKKNSKDNLLNFAFTEEMRVTGIGTVKSQAYRDQMKNQREERRPPKAPKPSNPMFPPKAVPFLCFSAKRKTSCVGFPCHTTGICRCLSHSKYCLWHWREQQGRSLLERNETCSVSFEFDHPSMHNGNRKQGGDNNNMEMVQTSF